MSKVFTVPCLLWMFCVVFALAGCVSSAGRLSDMDVKIQHISVGDTQNEILSLLGTPGQRHRHSRNDKGRAWQYCFGGWPDPYRHLTIWFYAGYVEGFTTRESLEKGWDCTRSFKEPRWEQAPVNLKVKLHLPEK